MKNKIRALFTFEILGKPPEHIKQTMEQLIDKLGELPGIEIDKRKIHEPKPVKDENTKDFFTTFSEVEILGEDLNKLTEVVFHAMPSHIEIIEPSELIFKNFDISGLLSSLTTKLHRYDEIAKQITLERNILVNKLNEMQAKMTQLEGNGENQSEKVKVAEEKTNKTEEKKPKKSPKKKSKKSSKKK